MKNLLTIFIAILCSQFQAGAYHRYIKDGDLYFRTIPISDDYLFMPVIVTTPPADANYVYSLDHYDIPCYLDIASLGYEGEVFQVVGIDDKAFANCTSIKSVKLPETITFIGSRAFENCTSLTTLDMGETAITEIPLGCCNGCTSLNNVVLPQTVNSIGIMAFTGSPLKNGFALPENVEQIEKHAFEASGLQAVDLRHVSVIGESALANTPIENVEWGEDLTEIGRKAFYNTKLSRVILPESIREIGDIAFLDSNVKEIICKSTDPDILVWGDYGPALENTVTLYVLDECLSDYQSQPWAEWFKAIKPIPEASMAEVVAHDNSIIEVYNMTGKRVPDDLSNLNNGVYIISNGVTTSKVAVSTAR